MSQRSAARVEGDLTPEQYLVFERAAETKHEYAGGEIIAFAGASRAHNLITGNIHYRLRTQLEGKPCEVYVAEMRVRATPTNYVYPDVVVVCGEPRFEDDEFDTLLDPTVLVEVLSPSTEARDRGDKLHHYASIESVRDYLLVSQDRIGVDHYVKQAGNEWKLYSYSRPEEKVQIESLACELLLADIYAQVQFSPTRSRLRDMREDREH
jgi:Uma2 family endonuclease